MERLYPMNKKEFKQKITLLLQAQDEESVFDGLYYAAMTYGKLDSNWLDGATSAQVRKLAEIIRRLEERELLPVPDDEEMVQVRLLISNYFAACANEPGPDILQEPPADYGLYHLTPAQIRELDISREQFKRGEFSMHEEVQQKMKAWHLQ